jgi:hypothetical protein
MTSAILKHSTFVVLALLAFSAIGFSQNKDAPTIYAESFRKGEATITEDNFDVKLTPADATYRERIKDSRGNDRYELTITPQVLEGGTEITSWRAMLRDLHHPLYSNILLADQHPSDDAKNNLWWLDPNRLSPVPIHANRIIKVEGFYVIFQVKQLHFTPLDSPYLDSMTVTFSFTNADPRNSH